MCGCQWNIKAYSGAIKWLSRYSKFTLINSDYSDHQSEDKILVCSAHDNFILYTVSVRASNSACINCLFSLLKRSKLQSLSSVNPVLWRFKATEKYESMKWYNFLDIKSDKYFCN